MTLTPEDVAKLTYPFKREDHDFLEGYVYISEEAITERIERIDPEWQFRIQQMIAYGDSVVCVASLTIKGVERGNGGGNPVQRDKADKDSNGNKTGSHSMLPLYTQADNGVNAHKAAITDALKRCARLFGIGRYLLSAPKQGGAFDKWLEQQHADAKAALLKLSQTNTQTGEITLPQPVTPQQPPPPAPSAPSPVTVAQNGAPDPNASASSTPAGSQNAGVSAKDDLFPAQVEGAVITSLDNGQPYTEFLCHELVYTVANGGSQYTFKSEHGKNIVTFGSDWVLGVTDYPQRDTFKNTPGKVQPLRPPLVVTARFDAKAKKWDVERVTTLEAVTQ